MYFLCILQEYGEDICLLDGEISYVDGVVECSIHPSDEHDDSDKDGGDGGVPYLLLDW